MENQSPSVRQLLADRGNLSYTRAKGHNRRIKIRYPEVWAKSTITTKSLTEWVEAHKDDKCPHCGEPVGEIDHILPLAKGGLHDFDNLQMLCTACNRSKHDITDEAFQAIKKGTGPGKDLGIDFTLLKDWKGEYYSKALFKEQTPASRRTQACLFSLGDTPVDGFISFKKVYMDLRDPTEYKPAMALLGSLDHWKMLCKLSWFREYLDSWRMELKALIKSETTDRMMAIAASGAQGALQALRTLVTEDFIYKSFVDDSGESGGKSRVGRPNKVVETYQTPDSVYQDDAKRIGLG